MMGFELLDETDSIFLYDQYSTTCAAFGTAILTLLSIGKVRMSIYPTPINFGKPC